MNPGHFLGNFPVNGDNNGSVVGNVGNSNRSALSGKSVGSIRPGKGLVRGTEPIHSPELILFPPIKKSAGIAVGAATKARNSRKRAASPVTFSSKVQPYTLATSSPSVGLDVLNANHLSNPQNVRSFVTDPRKAAVYSSNVNQRYMRNVGGSLNRVVASAYTEDHQIYETGDSNGYQGIEEETQSPRSYSIHNQNAENASIKIDMMANNVNSATSIEHSDLRLQDGRLKAKSVQTKVAIAQIGTSLPINGRTVTPVVPVATTTATSTNHTQPKKELKNNHHTNIVSVGSQVQFPAQHHMEDKRGVVQNNWRESLEYEKKKAFSKLPKSSHIAPSVATASANTTDLPVSGKLKSPILLDEDRKQIHSPEPILLMSGDQQERIVMNEAEYEQGQVEKSIEEPTEQNMVDHGAQMYVDTVIRSFNLGKKIESDLPVTDELMIINTNEDKQTAEFNDALSSVDEYLTSNGIPSSFENTIADVTEEEKALYYNSEDIVSSGSNASGGSNTTSSNTTSSSNYAVPIKQLPAIQEGAILRTQSFTVVDSARSHTPITSTMVSGAISDAEEEEVSFNLHSESPFILSAAHDPLGQSNYDISEHNMAISSQDSAHVPSAATPIDVIPLHAFPMKHNSALNEHLDETQALETPILLGDALTVDVDAMVEEDAVAKVALLVAPELTPISSPPQTLAQVRSQLQSVLVNEITKDTEEDEEDEPYTININSGVDAARDIFPALYHSLDTSNILPPPVTAILPSGAPITLNEEYMCLGSDGHDDAIAFASSIVSQVVQMINAGPELHLKAPAAQVSSYLPQRETVLAALAHNSYITAQHVCEESLKEGLVNSSDQAYRVMANKRAKRLRKQLHDRLQGKIVGITPRGSGAYQTRKAAAHTLEGAAFLTTRLGASDPENDVVNVLDFEQQVQLPMLSVLNDDPLRTVNHNKVQLLERLEKLDIEAQEKELTNSTDVSTAQNIVYSVPKVDLRIQERHALDFQEEEEDDFVEKGNSSNNPPISSTTVTIPLLQLSKVVLPPNLEATKESSSAYEDAERILYDLQSMEEGKSFFDTLNESEGYVFIGPGVAVQVPPTVPGQSERKRRALFASNLESVQQVERHVAVTLGNNTQQDLDRIAATHAGGMRLLLRDTVKAFQLHNPVEDIASVESSKQLDMQLALPSAGLREESHKRSVLFSELEDCGTEDEASAAAPVIAAAPSVPESLLNHPVARLCLRLGVHFPASFASLLSSKSENDQFLAKRILSFRRLLRHPIALKSLNQDPELLAAAGKMLVHSYSSASSQSDVSFVPSFLYTGLLQNTSAYSTPHHRNSFDDPNERRRSIMTHANASVLPVPRRSSVSSRRNSSFIDNSEQRSNLQATEKKDLSVFFKKVSHQPAVPVNPETGYTTQDVVDGAAAQSKLAAKGGCYVSLPGAVRNISVSVTNVPSERMLRATGVEGQSFLEEVDVLFQKHCCDHLVHKYGLDKLSGGNNKVLPENLQQDLLDAMHVLYSATPANPTLVPALTKPYSNNVFNSTHTNATPLPSHAAYTPTAAYPNPSNGVYVAPLSVNTTQAARVAQAYIGLQRVAEFLSKTVETDCVPLHSFSVPTPKPLQLLPAVSAKRTPSTQTKAFQQAHSLHQSTGKDLTLLVLHELMAYSAVGVARTYVRELYMSLSSRSLRKIATDQNAGAKAIVKDGLVFKHAHDPLVSKQPPQFMIGGSAPRDDVAADALSEEFHALSSVHRFMVSRNLPVFVPPAVLIDYCGHRVQAQAEPLASSFFDLLAPEDVKTLSLVYGSNDNGASVHDRSSAFRQIMMDMAKFFNLAAHSLQGSGPEATAVTLHTAGDVQGYVIDEKQPNNVVVEQVEQNQVITKQHPYIFVLHSLARMFPTESPLVTKHLPVLAASVFVRRLRAEFLFNTRQQLHPISSDALTAWGRDNYDVLAARANKASKLLLAKCNALAQWLDAKHTASVPKSSYLAAYLLTRCGHLNPLIVLRHAITAATLSQPSALQKAVKKYFLHAFRNVFHYFGPRSMTQYSHTGKLPEPHTGQGRDPSAVCIDWGILDSILYDYGDSAIEASVGRFVGVTTSTYSQHVQSMLDYWAGVYAQEGLSLPSFVDAWMHPFLATVNVTDVFHAWGIPVRHVEYVRKLSQSAAVRSKLLVELLSQGCKAVWADKVKDSIKEAHNTFKREFKKAVQQARVVGAPAPKPLSATNEAIRAELVLQEASMQASGQFLNSLLLAFAPRPSPNYSSIANIHGNSAQTEAVESVAGENTKITVASQTMVQSTATMYTWFHYALKAGPADPSLRHVLPVHLKFLKAGVSTLSTAQPEKLYAAITDRGVLKGTTVQNHINATCNSKIRAPLAQAKPTPSPDYSLLRQTWKDSVTFWSQTLPQKLQQLFGNISLGALGEALCALLQPVLDTVLRNLLVQTGITLTDQKTQRIRVAIFAIQRQSRRVSLKARRKQLLRNLSVARTVADANDAVLVCDGHVDVVSNGNSTIALLAHSASTSVAPEGPVTRIILESWLRGVYGSSEIEEIDDNELSDKEDDDMPLQEEDNACQCGLTPCICSFQPTLAPTTPTTGGNSAPNSPMVAPTPSRRRAAQQAQIHSSSDDKDDVALLSSAALMYCTTSDLGVQRAVVTRMPHVPALRAAATLSLAMHSSEGLLRDNCYGSGGVTASSALTTDRRSGVDRSIPLLAIPKAFQVPSIWTVSTDDHSQNQTISDEQLLHNLNVATSALLTTMWNRRAVRREAVTAWTQRVVDAVYLLHNDLYCTASTEYTPLLMTAFRALLTAQQAIYTLSVKSYVPAADSPSAIEFYAQVQKSQSTIELPAQLMHGVYQRYTWPSPPAPPIGYLRGLASAFVSFVNSRLSAIETAVMSHINASFDALKREIKTERAVPLSVAWKQTLTALPFHAVPSQVEHAPLPLRLALSCPAVADRVLLLIVAMYARGSVVSTYAQNQTDPLFTHTLLMSTHNVAADFDARFPGYLHAEGSSRMSARTPTSADRHVCREKIKNPLLSCSCFSSACSNVSSASSSVLSAMHSAVLLPKLLIDWFGADVNFRDSLCYGQTALHLASRFGLSCLARLLLQRGALVDTPDFYGQTPAMHAAMSLSPATLRTLSRAHANLTLVDRNCKGVLHHIITAEARNNQIFQICAHLGKDISGLLQNGPVTSLTSKIPHTTLLSCPLSQTDYDAFNLHCLEFMKEVSKVLKQNSDSYINIFSTHCNLPFDVLSRCQTAEARLELQEADLLNLPTVSHMYLANHRHRKRSKSPINSPVSNILKSLPDQVLAPHPATHFARKLECVSACIAIAMDYGVSLHAKCSHGETALFSAARHGLWRTMLSLVSYHNTVDHLINEEPQGHDIDHVDVFGCTPLMAALSYPPCVDSGLLIPMQKAVQIEQSSVAVSRSTEETDSNMFLAPPSLRARRQSIADNTTKDMLQSMASMVQRDKSRRRSNSRGRRSSNAGLTSVPAKTQNVNSVIAVNAEVVSLAQLKPGADVAGNDAGMNSADGTAAANGATQKAFMPAAKPLPYTNHHHNGLVISLLVALGANARAVDAQGFMLHDYAQQVDAISGKTSNVDCVYQLRQAIARKRLQLLTEDEEAQIIDEELRLDGLVCQCQWCATTLDLRSPTSGHALTAAQAVLRGIKWRRSRIVHIDSTLSLGMASITQNRRDVPFLIVNKRMTDGATAQATNTNASDSNFETPQVIQKKSRKDDFSMGNESNIVVASVRSPTKIKASGQERSKEVKASDLITSKQPTLLSKHPLQIKQPKVKISEIRKHIVEYLYNTEDVFAAFHSSSGVTPSSKSEETPQITLPARKPRNLHSDAFL